jgi:hypothetical protein
LAAINRLKKNGGRMSVVLNSIQLAGVTTYPVTPQIAPGFEPDIMIFRLTAGDGAYFSFDGKNDHWHFIAGDGPLQVPLHYFKIWLRQDGAIDPTTIDVMISSYGTR